MCLRTSPKKLHSSWETCCNKSWSQTLQVPARCSLGPFLLCLPLRCGSGLQTAPSGNFLADRKSCRADVGSGKVHVKDWGSDVV